jgi:hypothetical protein
MRLMFELWKLKYQRRKISGLFDKAIDECKADKTKNKDDLESLYIEESHEVGLVDDALNELVSDRLVDEAREFDVETPRINDDDGIWQKDWQRQRHFLSAKGRRILRTLIDEEKARRFEVKTRWVTKIILPVVASLVGILGAIAGLVAVIRRSR